MRLWFDVGFKRYTTPQQCRIRAGGLWFDVGFKRYTTYEVQRHEQSSCGLMQDSKDIQRPCHPAGATDCCGLMQDSKDIQLGQADDDPGDVVV